MDSTLWFDHNEAFDVEHQLLLSHLVLSLPRSYVTAGELPGWKSIESSSHRCHYYIARHVWDIGTVSRNRADPSWLLEYREGESACNLDLCLRLHLLYVELYSVVLPEEEAPPLAFFPSLSQLLSLMCPSSVCETAWALLYWSCIDQQSQQCPCKLTWLRTWIKASLERSSCEEAWIKALPMFSLRFSLSFHNLFVFSFILFLSSDTWF